MQKLGNDEARMSNDERMPKVRSNKIRHSLLRHQFVILIIRR
jgi:hypothetical protein